MIGASYCGYTGAIQTTEFCIPDCNALIKAGDFGFRNPIEDISHQTWWLVVLVMALAMNIRIESTSEINNSMSGGFDRNRVRLINSKVGASSLITKEETE